MVNWTNDATLCSGYNHIDDPDGTGGVLAITQLIIGWADLINTVQNMSLISLYINPLTPGDYTFNVPFRTIHPFISDLT